MEEEQNGSLSGNTVNEESEDEGEILEMVIEKEDSEFIKEDEEEPEEEVEKEVLEEAKESSEESELHEPEDQVRDELVE
jgi:hypothetical protein